MGENHLAHGTFIVLLTIVAQLGIREAVERWPEGPCEPSARRWLIIRSEGAISRAIRNVTGVGNIRCQSRSESRIRDVGIVGGVIPLRSPFARINHRPCDEYRNLDVKGIIAWTKGAIAITLSYVVMLISCKS